MTRIFCTLFLLGITAPIAYAQLLNKKGDEINPYYISFDAPAPYTVEDVHGEFLHVSYHDRIGKSESITLGVYNTKRELVRELQLVKQFGQNYFDIRLEEHGITFVENDSYVCRLTNEHFELRERLIRYMPEVKNKIVVSIIVKPRHLTCEGEKLGNNLVEFYGQMSGGMAPYKANWYVMNSRRTDFLYQPTHVVIPMPGLTSSVEVDKDPEYFVLLHVTDACGNEEIATVQIICHRNEKKINTLFFQKLDDVLLNKVENFK